MDGMTVSVFGAGITGLTAAHELVERGFTVTVYEVEPSWAHEIECTVGGMARTQWARTEKPDDRLPRPRMLSTAPLGFRFQEEDFVPFARGDTQLTPARDAVVRQLADKIRGEPVRVIDVHGFTAKRGMPLLSDEIPSRPPADDRHDTLRAWIVAERLRELLPDRTIRAFSWGLGLPYNWEATDDERSRVSLHVAEDWIPGEHGFRFFPSFYRHLFDTMRRTPVSEPDGPFRETGRTALDNVVPTTSQWLAFKGKAPVVLPRRSATSWTELFDVGARTLEALGCTASEAALLQQKLFKYATSCAERRRGYEDVSWWDFVAGDDCSEPLRTYLNRAPQLLVAMQASGSDARTIGTIMVQLMLDQLSVRERTDGTLTEPTSVAWFEHWRRYLVHQGVQFISRELVNLRPEGDQIVVWVDRAGTIVPVVSDFYLIAVPAHVARRLVRDATLQTGDCARIAALDLESSYEHLSGIQYYFDTDIPMVAGHVMYMDSAWGLSSISQPQFWTAKRGSWSGYRGVLSVDIGNWHTPGTRQPCAWECTRDEIAEEVWRQIQEHIDLPLPDPILYHLDEGVVFEPDGNGRAEAAFTRTPLLVNRPGTYTRRPGRPGAYQLHYGKLVFAGTYMQTHTRLTTMEAANESARHAVNAILAAQARESGQPIAPCPIWNPEDNELAELGLLVDLDRRLFAQGLPHILDSLDFGLAGSLPDLGGRARQGA